MEGDFILRRQVDTNYGKQDLHGIRKITTWDDKKKNSGVGKTFFFLEKYVISHKSYASSETMMRMRITRYFGLIHAHI